MYRPSGFAVDRFRLAGMFAIPAMRTGFLIESYTEERVAREKTQQSSDRADRITEQSSAENSHDDENKQCEWLTAIRPEAVTVLIVTWNNE